MLQNKILYFSNCHKLEVLDMTPADELTDDSFRQVKSESDIKNRFP